MINSSLKEKYWDSSTDKQMVISVVGTNQKIDNSMLEIGTFSLEESLCSESELKFGACEANCVKFTARNTAGSIIGKTISIEETIDGDSENPMPYGVFKVASDVPTADRTKRQITAYDAMYDIINADVKSWYAGLSFPMTLRQFRNSFFAHLGIAQVETNLVNDSMTVNKTIVATQTDDSSAVTEEPAISGKTVVTAICEINGCFGNINREGKFEYVFLKAITSALYPAEDLFPADNVFPSDANTESMTGHYITFDYEDFKSKAITQLEIKTSEDNAGAIVGTAGNNYSITGNFLVSDKTGAELEQIANNLLPIMAKAEYTPIKSCACVGNPCLTLGDPIRFNTTREIVETYLLQRTLTGVQSKRDSISAQGTQTHSAKVNSIRDTIESVERRTGKLERNADHLLSTYEDLEEQTNSKFEQTASGFEMSVTGGDKTVGIVIKLLNSDGDVISESSENANITITGVVRFEDLAQSGATIINGANITTGTINCDLLNGGTIKGQDIVGGRIASENIYCIDSLYMSNRMSWTGEDASLAGAEKVMYIPKNDTWVHFAQVVVFDSGVLFSSIPTVDGVSLATVNSTVNKAKNATNATYLKNGSYVYISSNGNFIPGSSDMWCGTTVNPFTGGYSTDGWKTTSDERVKKDFVSLDDDKRFESFFYLLNPTEYKLKSDKYGFVRVGFGAQTVKAAMDAAGIAESEFHGFSHEYVDMSQFETEEERQQFLERNCGNADTYSLSYQEFIALNTHMIQKQHQEIEQLKSDNFALKGEVDILKQRLEKMEEMLNVINSKIN